MKDIIAAHTQAARWHRAAPPQPGDCLQVEGVAPVSVAAAAGVERGHLLHAIDRSTAIAHDPLALAERVPHVFRFHAPASGDDLELVATSIPLGLRLRPSDAALANRFAAGRGRLADLLAIWGRGDWSLLGECAARAAGHGGRARRLLRHFGSPRPAQVFEAAAAIEAGDRQQGLALLGAIDTAKLALMPPVCRAVASYYDTIAAIDGIPREDDVESLRACFRIFPLERVADHLCRLGAERPSAERWCGSLLELDYRLTERGAQGAVSLSATISELGKQALILAALGDDPEDAVTRALIAAARRAAMLLPGTFAAVHAIRRVPATESADPALREVADAEPVVHLLADHDGVVHGQLGCNGLPLVLVVDARGQVLRSRFPDEVELWAIAVEALAAAAS